MVVSQRETRWHRGGFYKRVDLRTLGGDRNSRLSDFHSFFQAGTAIKIERVADLMRRADEILAAIDLSNEPILITSNETPIAYLASVRDSESMQRKL